MKFIKYADNIIYVSTSIDVNMELGWSLFETNDQFKIKTIMDNLGNIKETNGVLEIVDMNNIPKESKYILDIPTLLKYNGNR